MSAPHLLDGHCSEELPSFLVAFCTGCDREVLTARDLNEHDEVVDVCMHCETPTGTTASQPRWVAPPELITLGYFLDGYVTEDEDAQGGCRGGSCGVRQPSKQVSHGHD